MRYLASVSYDGSSFYGFQRLKDHRSVQEEIEKVLAKIDKRSVTVKGAGRTDRGVHAKDQKCHFDMKLELDPNSLKKAMNSLLPDDIYINNCLVVDDYFHARFNVRKKIYTYVINMGERNVIYDKYLYNYCKKLDVKMMKIAAKKLVGAHSYKAFVAGDRENYNSLIYNIELKKRKDVLIVRFTGTSFYRYMVRNLVGALILVGSNKCGVRQITEMLDSGENIYHYTTVPSNGLYLEKIYY